MTDLWPRIEGLLRQAGRSIERPARYLNHEWGCTYKPEASYRFCMTYPDTYELGQANQAVSPVFMSVLKTFCIIAVIFMTIGVARVALAGVTAQVLNSNAELTNTLEKATDESSDLEVMHSVYGADTRIRDLAGAYGMVEPSESVTLDFSQDAAAGANATATAQ